MPEVLFLNPKNDKANDKEISERHWDSPHRIRPVKNVCFVVMPTGPHSGRVRMLPKFTKKGAK